MSISPYKTWSSGEVLTAADLNASFTQITNNALSLISPLTGSLDANGNEIILDADADTSITADTDDQIDFRIGGTDTVRVVANGLVMPALCSFSAYNSAEDVDQTGNGAAATVAFDTEIFDRNADFAANTFTAPVTGLYYLKTQVTISDWSATATSASLAIVTSNRTYTKVIRGTFPTTDVNQSFDLAVFADMDAADTATVTITISGLAGNTLDITGDATPLTHFMGWLVA